MQSLDHLFLFAKEMIEKEKISAKHQSDTLFCLCISAFFVSAPLNGLSPSLSLVAKELGLTVRERDVYLGGYISLSTMLGQMFGSCFSGVFTDLFSRKLILVGCLVAGSISMTLFGLISHYPTLLFLRVVTGCCQGAIVPVIFSLIGDFYASEERASTSSIVSSCLGGGMMIGQLFTGFFLDYLGWRLPFILMGSMTFVAAIFVLHTLREPQKGAREQDLQNLLETGVKLPPLSTSKFIQSMMVPTVMIMIFQTIPNTIPWGVLSAHLHDFLATDAKLSMRKATTLIGLFGAGSAFGGLFGGFIGAKLYVSNRMFLPLFMGVSMGVSALLMKELLLLDLSDSINIQFAIPVLILSGSFAAVNGANIRVIVLNMTSPEARGAAIAVLNFVNCIGRGIGPSLADYYMSSHFVSRREAVSFFLNFWLFSGSVLLLACWTVAKDEDKLRTDLKRFALQHHEAGNMGSGGGGNGAPNSPDRSHAFKGESACE